MRAIVVGATGAVGRDLVEALCADPRYTEVRTFTRRELGVDDPKLRPYVVDFERTEGWHDLVQGDVIFSALGTSKKQAGSKEAGSATGEEHDPVGFSGRPAPLVGR